MALLLATGACGKDSKVAGATGGGVGQTTGAPAAAPSEPASVAAPPETSKPETSKPKTSKPESSKPEATPSADVGVAASAVAVTADVAAAPPPSPVVAAKVALNNPDSPEATAALTALKDYLKTAAATDAGEAKTLLVTAGLEIWTRAAVNGTDATAVKGLLTSDGKTLIPALADALGDAAGTQALVSILSGELGVGQVEALAALSKAPEGADKGRQNLALMASLALNKAAEGLVAAFAVDGTAGKLAALRTLADANVWRCDAAGDGDVRAACGPEWFGVTDAAALLRLPDSALSVARFARLARLLGDKAPTGKLLLPVSSAQAPVVTFGSGESASALPVSVAVIGPAGLALTERVVLDLGTGAVTGNPDATTPLAPSVVLEGIKDSEAATATAKTIKVAADAARTSAGDVAGLLPTTNTASVAVVVAGETPAKLLMASLGVLVEAGLTDVRFLRGDGSEAPIAVPLSASAVPEARRGREETSLRVTITAEGYEVTPPRSKAEPMAPVDPTPIPLPATATPTKKGDKLQKVVVAGTDTAVLVETVRSVRHSEGAGFVVEIVADDAIPASRVLEVVAAVAAAPGTPQTKLSEVFPGLVCKDEDATLTNDACRSLFPVLPATLPAPKKEGEPVKKPDAPPPEPEEKLGFCEKGDIESVIKARTGSIKFCYERELQMQTDLTGRVVVRLKIGANGAVTDASSSGNMPSKSVHSCVVKAMRALKFKPPAGGGACVVSYPFNFQP